MTVHIQLYEDAIARRYGNPQRDPAACAEGGKVLTFGNVLPPARGRRDELLRAQLEQGDVAVSARAALELASAYAATVPKVAAGLLLRAACGPPVTAGRALLRLARLAGATGDDTEQRKATIRDYLDRAQYATTRPSEGTEALDPELLEVRVDIAAALAFAGSVDAALPTLLDIERLLRNLGDPNRGGVPQDERFRRLAALVSLRLGQFQMESDPRAADGELERAVMLGTGSVQATAALERGRLLEHHAGGLGPEIERQYMLAVDLDDPVASLLALLAVGDILWESGRREKARAFWKQATVFGDPDIMRRVERRMQGVWQREKRAFKREGVGERLDYALPLQGVNPSTELGRLASGRAPDAPRDNGQRRPVIVVGAGTGGHYLLPALEHGYRVVGFVDDDTSVPAPRGISILGSTAQLESILQAHRQVVQVIFAIPTASGTTRLRVLRAAHRRGVEVLSLPPMFELRHGHPLLSQLRPFEVHETYGDTPWSVDREAHSQVRSRRVAVVGASTVLGAEVARRVAQGQPRHLLLIDEPSVPLMGIASEIRQLRGLMDCDARVVDCAAHMELAEALASAPRSAEEALVSAPRGPEVVFYCGGVDHAPSDVLSPSHAARANVLTASTVAYAAREAGCAELVMASADRAAHRSSQFDMTKALAETAALRAASRQESAKASGMLQVAGESEGLRVSVLRLPNLWAKDGAAVGRLSEQLRHGGPLRVKPGARRRFAPTWEAAQTMLRLLEGTHASGIFALGAGETVEIRELAERLLLIHGLVAARDIQIVSLDGSDTKASLQLCGRDESCGPECVRGAFPVAQRPELRKRLNARCEPLLTALRMGRRGGVEAALEPLRSIADEDERVAAAS